MEDKKQRIDTARLGIRLFNNIVPSADGREKVKGPLKETASYIRRKFLAS